MGGNRRTGWKAHPEDVEQLEDNKDGLMARVDGRRADELRLIDDGIPFLSAIDKDRILGGTALALWEIT